MKHQYQVKIMLYFLLTVVAITGIRSCSKVREVRQSCLQKFRLTIHEPAHVILNVTGLDFKFALAVSSIFGCRFHVYIFH